MNRKPLQRRNPKNPVIREYDEAVRRGGRDYHVVPHEQGWIVMRIGSARKSGIYEKQDHAVDIARKHAKRERVELFIHGKDGRIRERNSYGNDPIQSAEIPNARLRKDLEEARKGKGVKTMRWEV